MQLQNYAAGQWVAGSGKQAELVDASTGELIATTSSGGLDFAAMLHYARTVGGPPLRKMTFPERGRMLKALALHLMEQPRRGGPQGAKATEDRGSTTLETEKAP